jgi:NAD-dependent DNA ligase
MGNDNYGKLAGISKNNNAKAVQVLLGICSGLVADGSLNEKEILFLGGWIIEHPEVTSSWPGNVIANRINDILTDGVITAEERDDLLQTLQELSGNFFNDTGVAQQEIPSLPIDQDAVIEFKDKSVCFTGKFIFGSRETCESTTANLGAIVDGSITKKLDFLVIGALASPDWLTSTYGRKIEKAVGYRTQHGKPYIVSEQQWTNAVHRHPNFGQ